MESNAKILMYYKNFKLLGLLPCGADSINDLPTWMCQGFVVISDTAHDAELIENERQIDSIKKQIKTPSRR